VQGGSLFAGMELNGHDEDAMEERLRATEGNLKVPTKEQTPNRTIHCYQFSRFYFDLFYSFNSFLVLFT
jgi:hypothetical protein